jgi:hypothetical protein
MSRPAALWWASLLGLCIILIAPLFIVDVPPLVDYPNHLARVFILSALPNDPVIAAFYQPHWAIIPNLALDLVVPPLLRVMPVHDAGRLMIGLAVLLPVLGTIAYSRALGGRWWALAVGLVAYNGTLLEGFLNFSLSVGLALLFAAAWLRWRDRHPWAMAGIAAAGAVALFACHLMGLLFYGLLLASAECFRPMPDRPVRALVARAAVLALIFAAPAGLYAASALGHLQGAAEFLPPGQKLLHLMAPFTNYSLSLDVVTAVLAVSWPCLCLTSGRGRMPGPVALAAAALMVGYMAAPYAWKGTFQLDTRLVIMLGFLIFAGFQPARWPIWLSRAVAACVVALFVARMALLTTAWAEHRADLADLRLALAPVLPGQAVYVASVSPIDPAGYWARAPWSRRLSDGVQTDTHLGALALIERRSWWPFEFDIPSQQPIETLPPYRGLAGQVGDLPDQAALLKADLCGFDVVLLTQADAAPELPTPRFRLLVRSGFAASYAITRCRPGD